MLFNDEMCKINAFKMLASFETDGPLDNRDGRLDCFDKLTRRFPND